MSQADTAALCRVSSESGITVVAMVRRALEPAHVSAWPGQRGPR